MRYTTCGTTPFAEPWGFAVQRGMGQNSRKRQRQPTPAPAPVPVRSADPSQDAKDIDVTPCFSFYNMVMELYATGGTAQVAREFVSNSIDSRSRSIKFAPFPFPADKAGFAVADDGHGMSRPSKDQVCAQVRGSV